MRTKTKPKSQIDRKLYDQMLDLCNQTSNPVLDKFLILMSGKLGLRLGEIRHFNKNWVNFEREYVSIPDHEPCSCSDCRKDIIRRKKQLFLSSKRLEAECWKPKTKAGSRTIPFGFDKNIKSNLMEFNNLYERCPLTKRQIENRIRCLGKAVGIPNCLPHDLRCYAAINFIYAGIDGFSLCHIMGWDSKWKKFLQIKKDVLSFELKKKMHGNQNSGGN